MSSTIIKYLTAIILYFCLSASDPGFSVRAQQLDFHLSRGENFGHSLKKPKKEQKDKPNREKQNIAATVAVKTSNNPTDDDAIRVETTMVLSEILVLDQQGKHVPELKKEDFFIKEDGELQEISTFISGDDQTIPRSIVLIIDYSSSQLPFIETSVNAAKVLIGKLNPNDRIAIVTDNVELLQDFTSDKNLLNEKLESLKVKALSGQMGLSRQYSALMATLNELFDDKALRPIIIFQTDGDQFPELKGEIANLGSSTQAESLSFGFRDILTATERFQATIYTIIPGLCFDEIPENNRLDRLRAYFEERERIFAQMRKITAKSKINKEYVKSQIPWFEKHQTAITRIAKHTGGSSKCLEKTEQAEQVYSQILSEMNQRYVIGYYPLNQTRDGKRRNVTTEVRGNNYKILGRKTYIF
jgi:Ca-activated chloride channel family protein